MVRLLSDDEITTQLNGLPAWRRVHSEHGPAIGTRYERDDFAGAIALLNEIADTAEEMDHHPDLDIRWNKVTVVLCTHSAGGLTQLDIEAAHRFDATASR